MKTVQLKTIEVTVVTPGEPVQISTNPIFVSDFNFQPKVGNSGTYCYIGEESTDVDKISYSKGSITNFTVGNADPVKDNKFDLSRLWIDSDTGGDKVIVQYRVHEK